MFDHKPHWPTPEQMGLIEKACRRIADRTVSEVLTGSTFSCPSHEGARAPSCHELRMLADRLGSELHKPVPDAWSLQRELLRSRVGLGGFKIVLLDRMGKRHRMVKSKSKVGRRSLRVCTDPGGYPLKKGEVLFARQTNTFHLRRDDAHLLPADIRGLL